MTEAFESLRD